jgi:hypothetical protein
MASVIRAIVRNVGKYLVYIWIDDGSGHRNWLSEPRDEEERWSHVWAYLCISQLLPSIPHFSPDDRGSMVLRNIGNTANFHMVPAPESRISISGVCNVSESVKAVKREKNNMSFI